MKYTSRVVNVDSISSVPTFRVIAAYKFTRLTELPVLREHLRAVCKNTSLKGTILLSPEGINMFISGLPEDVDAFLNQVRALPGLEDLEAKESRSTERPFNLL